MLEDFHIEANCRQYIVSFCLNTLKPQNKASLVFSFYLILHDYIYLHSLALDD